MRLEAEAEELRVDIKDKEYHIKNQETEREHTR